PELGSRAAAVPPALAGRAGRGAGRAGPAGPAGSAVRRGSFRRTGGCVLQHAGEGVPRIALRPCGRHRGLVGDESGHGGGRRIGDRLRKGEHRGSYSPIRRVLSISCRAVFMTSTLFWYEREAEIMFTISSTTLTLLWVT